MKLILTFFIIPKCNIPETLFLQCKILPSAKRYVKELQFLLSILLHENKVVGQIEFIFAEGLKEA